MNALAEEKPPHPDVLQEKDEVADAIFKKMWRDSPALQWWTRTADTLLGVNAKPRGNSLRPQPDVTPWGVIQKRVEDFFAENPGMGSFVAGFVFDDDDDADDIE